MEVLQMSAVELSKKIKSGAVTVKEAVNAYRNQMQIMEPKVNAFLSIDDTSLAKRIQEVAAGIASGKYQGPLAGVPIAVKDNICTKGQKTTCASRMLENFIPTYDAEVVRRLKEAGMIVLGKTNMDEFAMGSTSETSAFGVTRNPWNLERVPGGSSGGSCAAVAAGEAPLALGSDTGGSIRQPAAFCGVVGLKPTYGRVSRYGLIAYASSLDQIGPIGKNVQDCAAFYEVISGYDEKDSTSYEQLEAKDLPIDLSEDVTKKVFAKTKIGVPTEYFSEGTDIEVKEALKAAIALMEEQGAQIKYFSLGMVDYVIPAYYIIACAQASSNLERFDGVKYGHRCEDAKELHDMYKRSRAGGFGEEVKRRIMLGSFVLSAGYYDAYYLKALKTKAMIKKSFDEAFASYDCILAPVTPSAPPKLNTSLQDPLQMYLSDIYTVAVNLAGLPAISLPCKRDKAGLPIGIQLIGDCFKEDKLLSVAAAYESVRGPFPMAWEKEGE